MNFPTIFEFSRLDNRYKQIGSVSVLKLQTELIRIKDVNKLIRQYINRVRIFFQKEIYSHNLSL